MDIYSTPDMEECVRVMMRRNHRVVLFRHHASAKKIRFRGNKIADIPQTIARPWDAFCDDTLSRWQNEGGLLHYWHWRKAFKLPTCEAMLYVECPTQYQAFEAQTRNVAREVVVYRPPTWAIHEENINSIWGNSHSYYTLELIIKSLVGAERMPRIEAALKLSGFPPERTAAFTSGDINAIAGMSDRQVRYILQAHGFRSYYDRYHCFTPQIEPDPKDEGLLWAYKLLEAVPPTYAEQRMLRFECLAPRVKTPGFNRFLKVLVQKGYVTRHPNIYVVMLGYAPINYLLIDAISTARRGDWYKMRNIVDNAPEYLL